jgi:WD40 repeat protein/tetratricopeptide (TPR) repeat protein
VSCSGKWFKNAPGEIRVWDTSSGVSLASLAGHSRAVAGVAFMPSGERLVSSGFDGTVRIWDMREFALLAASHVDKNFIRCVACSHDGRYIAAGGREFVYILDGTTAVERTRLSAPKTDVTGLHFGPDAKQLVSANWDGTVRLWNVDDWRELYTLQPHQGVLWSVEFSPDGKQVATAGADGTFKVWEVSSGEVLYRLPAHTGAVYGVTFSWSGRHVLSCGWDRGVKLGDFTGYDSRRDYPVLGGWMPQLAFTPDGKRVAVCSSFPAPVDSVLQLQVLETEIGRVVQTIAERPGGFRSLALSRDGRKLAAGCDRDVKVWDAQSGLELFTLRGHASQVSTLDISPNSRALVSASEDGSIMRWDLATGKRVSAFADESGPPSGVVFVPDGIRIVSAGQDGLVREWDSATGKLLSQIREHSAPIVAIAFSTNGLFASASKEGAIRLSSRFARRQPVQLLLQIPSSAGGRSNAFIPENQVEESNTRETLAGETSPPTMMATGRSGRAMALSFSPDGQRLAGACDDGSVRVWETDTGHEVLSFPGVYRATVGGGCVRFSPDSRWLACASSTSRMLRLWDAGPAPDGVQARRRWYAHETEALIERTDALIAGKEYQTALPHLDALIDEQPQDADLHRRRARVHTALRNSDAGLDDYRRAIQIAEQRCTESPENSVHALQLATFWCEFGNVLRNGERRGEAVACFTQAIDRLVPLMDVQPEVLGVRGQLQSCYWGRAYALGDLGRTADAIADWDRTIELQNSSPWQWQAFQGRAQAHSALGNFREAYLDFAAALQLNPENPQLRQQIVALRRAAGDRGEAAAALREAVLLNPKLGDILKAEDDLDAAIAEYREAVRLNPKDVGALVNLGRALHQRNDLKAAEEVFRAAVAVAPENDYVHDWLGYVLMCQGELDSALESFQEAIRLNPKHAKAHVNRGHVLRRKGDRDGAIDAYRKALEADPDFVEAQSALNAILVEKN